MALARGIEPRLHVFQTGVQPLHQARMEEGPGIEPSHALSNVSPFSRRMNAIARRLPNTKLEESQRIELCRALSNASSFSRRVPTIQCCSPNWRIRRDSNPHNLSVDSLANYCVYQFRH